MKKILFSIISFMLAAASPVAAQETECANPYGVRVESVETYPIQPLHAQQNNTDRRKASATDAKYGEKIIISYMSLDGKKDSVRLSAALYIRKDHYYDKILLNCHPTVTSNFEAPSGAQPVDQDIRRIAEENFLVVCPDYCGYGHSTYKQHPYLIHDVTARNCIDAAMAALYYAENILHSTAPSSFSTYIVGYSQGGATALACQKYLESEGCDRAVKARLNLKETCCGDGPYSTVATVKQYVEWGIPKNQGGPDKDLEYPCVLPLIVAAAKEAYGEGCMRTVEVEDYFSDDFKATGIIDMIKNKDLTTVDLNSLIRSKMGRLRPVDVFSENMIDKTTGQLNDKTNEYKCLMRAMEKNDLTQGWVPVHPLTFYHLKQDGVVPYVNLEEFIKKLYDPNKDRILDTSRVTNGLDLIVEIGILFGMAEKPNYSTANHAEGGTLFYEGYLFTSHFRR